MLQFDDVALFVYGNYRLQSFSYYTDAVPIPSLNIYINFVFRKHLQPILKFINHNHHNNNFVSTSIKKSALPSYQLLNHMPPIITSLRLVIDLGRSYPACIYLRTPCTYTFPPQYPIITSYVPLTSSSHQPMHNQKSRPLHRQRSSPNRKLPHRRGRRSAPLSPL